MGRAFFYDGERLAFFVIIGDEAVEQAVAYLTHEQSRRVRFLFMAYIVIWAALGAYIMSIARRQTRIEAEIARLKDSA